MDRRCTPDDARRERTPHLALFVLAAAMLVTGVAAPAASADGFSCRASAIRVTGLAGVGLPEAEPAVANAANDPCAAESATIASSPPELATVLSTGAAHAVTTVDAEGATAAADVSNPSVLGAVLGGVSIDQLSASAGYQCVDGEPVAESDSQVTGLSALGQPPVTTDQPQQLHYAGLADVTLNDTVSTATSVTRRAVTIDLLPILFGGVQIVLGEARAGITGNPCPAVPDPPADPDPDPGAGPGDPGAGDPPPSGSPSSQSPATVSTPATIALSGSSKLAVRCRVARRTSSTCAVRRVVGRIGSRTVRVGGTRVRVTAIVPRMVRGPQQLRFVVRPARRHVLRSVRFRMGGRALRQQPRSVGLTASRLAANGTQVLRIRLVPRRGQAVVVRIRFRTRQV